MYSLQLIQSCFRRTYLYEQCLPTAGHIINSGNEVASNSVLLNGNRSIYCGCLHWYIGAITSNGLDGWNFNLIGSYETVHNHF